MLNQEYIRNQVLLVAQPGMWTEQAVRNICAEAERHAKDCAEKSLTGTLYEDQTMKGRSPLMALIAEDLRAALGVIQEWKAKARVHSEMIRAAEVKRRIEEAGE
jgi:hypothetical protein